MKEAVMHRVSEWAHREKRTLGKQILRALYFTEVEDRNGHLDRVRDFLAHDPKRALILYSNHIAYDDPVVELFFHEEFIDPKHERHLIIPASAYHLKHNRMFKTAADLAHFFFDAEIIPLVQEYMVDNPAYGYTKDDFDQSNAALRARGKELADAGIPVSFLVYPEGHRSEDQALRDSGKGIVYLSSLFTQSVLLPLGVEPHNERSYSRDTTNFKQQGRTALLHVGEPTYNEKRGRPPFGIGDLMQKLAATLPPRMRGFYGSQ